MERYVIRFLGLAIEISTLGAHGSIAVNCQCMACMQVAHTPASQLLKLAAVAPSALFYKEAIQRSGLQHERYGPDVKLMSHKRNVVELWVCHVMPYYLFVSKLSIINIQIERLESLTQSAPFGFTCTTSSPRAVSGPAIPVNSPGIGSRLETLCRAIGL